MEIWSGLSRRDLMRVAAAAPLASSGHEAVSAQTSLSRNAISHTPQLDAGRLPFSRYGSYWAISKLWWEFGASKNVPVNEWYIRILEDEATPNEIFRLEMLSNGQTVPFEGHLTPATLTLSAASGATVEFIVAETQALRVRGRNCTLRLHAITSSYSYAVQQSRQTWELASINIPRIQVRAFSGLLNGSARWVDELQKASCSSIKMDLLPDANGVFECSIEYYDAVPSPDVSPDTFDTAHAKVQQEFDLWAGTLPALKPNYEEGRKAAAWVLWSSTVGPRGLYRTPVVWCSKSWMNRIWSWDHCFVAVGLAPSFPELAWQQLMIFQQMQDSGSGMLADSMNNIQRSWICTKPPVHGWALQHLMRSMQISREQLREVYEPLRAWTNFWLKYRDLDGDGLPCILNPNESFDNTTSNTLFGPVKPPEIAAYLAIQLEVLGRIAQQLGYAQEGQLWQTRSKTMIDTLVHVLWNEEAGKFQARRVGDGKTAEGDCIYSYVPIVLGRRLPESIVRSITKALREPGRFLTPYGLASEALSSPRYEPRSYVKGPVWAPPCTFITEGLSNVGEKALASQIRRSFMDVCLQHGMSEHFDAKTGAPAGDPGYNWTAAMFIHFAREEQLFA